MNVGTESGAIAKGSASIITLVGALGSGTITDVKAGTESSLTGIFELNVEGHEGTGSRMTFTNRWQTSEDPAYVGADADLYIGKSTNIIMGTGDAVEILRDGEFNTENVKSAGKQQWLFAGTTRNHPHGSAIRDSLCLSANPL